MKKFLILLIALSMIISVVGAGLAAGQKYSGYLVNEQGKKIQVIEFLSMLVNFPCAYQDSETGIPMKKIKSLTLTEDNKIILQNRSGKKFKVVGEMNVCFTDMVSYISKNPIDGKVMKTQIDPLFVKKIVFD